MATERYDDIRKDEFDRKKEIEKQITTIELRQQELQGYIAILDGSVQQLDSLVYHEQKNQQPDWTKISNWRGAMSKNIELLTKVYSTYREYEDIKFKCRILPRKHFAFYNNNCY